MTTRFKITVKEPPNFYDILYLRYEGIDLKEHFINGDIIDLKGNRIEACYDLL